MQPQDYPFRSGRVQRLWSRYVERGELSGEELAHLDPAVWQSWQRCRPRFDPYALPRLKRLSPASLQPVRRAHTVLTTMAAPLMEDIHQFIEGSDCAIVLTTSAGCVLDYLGDAAATDRLRAASLDEGSYWSEEHVGTNAVGLVRMLATPVQVVGPEHYLHIYHSYATTAAPVYDVRGRMEGILVIVGPASGATSHTLGLVMTAARALSNQLQTDWYVEEANRHLSEVNTTLGAVSEGIIAWDATGVIRHANALAGQMLGRRRSVILGRKLEQVLSLPEHLLKASKAGEELHDVELTLNANGDSVSCLLSLRPVVEGDEPIGAIALLRPMEQVRRLVHAQMGTNVTLHLDDVTSQSRSMRATLRQARVAARGQAPVLLRGDGGAGKNYLARAIHNDGPRASGPFIGVNCRAIPHELMISEFLGSADSSNSRPSKFELANGGTLLLDQVENLSLEMQAALLQLIETGHVLRLGSVQPIAVDVRIIAAATADLEELVADGSFSSHLYYRFGVFNIYVPPLRERPEDIPLLAERVLARFTATTERATWMSDEAMAVLSRYPWPGNVRELESVLERALSQCQDSTIQLSDLPAAVRAGRVVAGPSPRAEPLLSLAETEREAIVRAGWACQGHVTEMAELLQIGRTTLWRKMKRYNLRPDYFKVSGNGRGDVSE
ncbi:MAG: dihydroxyacetone kinase operon transcriptional regulator DhaR [Anaerolineae bacterium]|nr:dihydroxyacetone kinase operon transcriptional regulator DhaR [Anaerolineae bacterium]